MWACNQQRCKQVDDKAACPEGRNYCLTLVRQSLSESHMPQTSIADIEWKQTAGASTVLSKEDLNRQTL